MRAGLLVVVLVALAPVAGATSPPPPPIIETMCSGPLSEASLTACVAK
jgi:hypothetical protein